jgi:hypothetical protein
MKEVEPRSPCHHIDKMDRGLISNGVHNVSLTQLCSRYEFALRCAFGTDVIQHVLVAIGEHGFASGARPSLAEHLLNMVDRVLSH